MKEWPPLKAGQGKHFRFDIEIPEYTDSKVTESKPEDDFSKNDVSARINGGRTPMNIVEQSPNNNINDINREQATKIGDGLLRKNKSNSNLNRKKTETWDIKKQKPTLTPVTHKNNKK